MKKSSQSDPVFFVLLSLIFLTSGLVLFFVGMLAGLRYEETPLQQDHPQRFELVEEIWHYDLRTENPRTCGYLYTDSRTGVEYIFGSEGGCCVVVPRSKGKKEK